MSDNNNGLSDDEIIKLLFKNYMNSTTTSDGKLFYEETLLSNNSNISSSGILIDTPPIYSSTPSLINVSNDVSLSEYLSYSAIPDISINDSWFNEKTQEGSFSVNSTDDNDRKILRLESIKLDYLGGGSAAFVCNDNNGVNILQNLIPSNYSTSGYSISLQYKHNNTLKSVGWLATRSELAGSAFIGSSVNFGGALFDTKNGVVTFYDVNGTESDIFSNAEFYLSATKYIGLNNINVLRFLEVIGDVSMQSDLDVSNSLFVHNNLFVDNDASFGSHLQVVGDVSMESNLDISSNLHVKGNATFGIVSSNAEDVSNNNSNIYVYGNLRIMDGGNLVIQDVSNTTVTDLRTEVQITDSLDISNDGTSTALIVNQLHTDNYKIVEFKDAAETVFSVGKNGYTFIRGDVSMESNLDISENLHVFNELNVEKDVSFGSHLQVVGDVSMESNVDISENLHVFNQLNVEKDVSFGSHLQVVGDVSMESNLDISENLHVFNQLNVEKDVSFGSHLQVVGDVSMESNVDISENLHVFNELNVEKDVSFGSHLQVVGDVSMESNVDISENLHVFNQLNVEKDVSFGNHLFVSGDASFGSTVEISGLMVTEKNFIFETNTTEKMIIDTSNITLLNNDPSYSALDISATSALRIPVGTQDQRPTIQNTGQIRYNTSTKQFEGYGDTGKWQGLGGIIDVDQDTFILAETQPDADNDQIQIFTASFERMKVDASGNIQMMNSDSTYSALDISATSALLIPGGTKNERPTNSENPRALRFNSDTSLCEVYTESNIWSGIPVYKTEQPPALLDISQVKLSETVTVNWEKFPDIYKDVFDGKCYPIYLQTFVDISFTDINGTGKNTNGWETIIIGAGNYDETGTATTPLTTFQFNSVVSTNYNNSTGYTIDFTDKPQDTVTLPVFTQDDSFDLRIYGVNKSGTSPNYNYIYNVQLKQTGPPGEIDVILFESFGKNDFDVDLSFALDSNDTSITSGISIVNYDVSFTLSGTKSLENRDHSGNQETSWTNATSLNKSDLNVYNLFPGAQYDIQVRAQNALKFDSNGAYMDGSFGDVFTSSGFTNNSNDTTGTSTTQYIDTGDLSGVDSDALQFSLVNTASINCYVDGINSRSNRTIGNSTSYINITGTSEFYVNYGLQGIDMSGVDDLVQATVELEICGNVVSSQTITYNGTNNPSSVLADTIDISNGGTTFYQFSSVDGYTDEFDTPNYNNGFVYSSTFSRTDSNDLSSVFVDNFPASTDYYNLLYTISSQTNNNSKQIDNDGNTSTTDNTGNFYVDDYLSTPTVTWTQDPTISVTGSTVLFGIPSVSSVNLQYKFDVSGFANHIIPTKTVSNTNNVHSYVAAITKNSYSFSQQKKTGIYTNDSYTITFNSTDSSITNDRYDDTTTSDVTVRVYYLDNTGTPTISYIDDNQKDVPDIGHIFKDTATSYSAFSLYTFNGSDTIGTSAIDTDNSDFINTYSSNISSMLLYFDSKFVSGGYNTSYTTTTNNLYPFDDWSTSGGGYAVDGPNYSNYSDTGINGFKWIVLEIPTSKISGNNVDLGDFKVNNAIHSTKTFTTDYEAYIYQDGAFGALNQVSTTNLAWYSDSQYYSSISDAKTRPAGLGGALQGSTSSGTYGTDAFINASGGTSYLIVGLPQNSNSYFTYS